MSETYTPQPIATDRFPTIDYQLDRLLHAFATEVLVRTLETINVGNMPDLDLTSAVADTDRHFTYVQERMERTDYMHFTFKNVAGIMKDWGDDHELAKAIGGVISEHCNILHGDYAEVVGKLLTIAKSERTTTPEAEESRG